MNISDKLHKLRQSMVQNAIDTVIITKNDPHQSEYSPAFWNSVQFISGFSGSAGVVVVTASEAGLWTDGRYYIQASKELNGSGFTLHRAADPGVKNFLTFAKDATPINGCIAFDGRTISMEQAKTLIKTTKAKKIKLKSDLDLVANLWENRPPLSAAPIYDFDICFCGKSRLEKISQLQTKLKANDADLTVLSSTDDIAWLFNLRGNDVGFSTCFAAFAVIDLQQATLFVHKEKSQAVTPLLNQDGILVKHYAEIYPFLETNYNERTLTACINPATTSYSLFKAMASFELAELAVDFTTHFKAIKNDVELANLEKLNVRDGVAMVRFIKWVKENAHTGLTEYTIGEKITQIRATDQRFVGPSFGTIAAYMQNAAMMHYTAKPNDCATIKAEGFLLVDSGGHYYDGTTDITRTIALGALTDQMKTDFTLVLKSHIAMASTVFLHGATGSNLDVIARLPMWQQGLDYKCGTGHGLGFFLNVHEGPQSLRPSHYPAMLEVGMVLTNEPGIYKQDVYGIRTENTMTIVPHQQTDFGTFLKFSIFSYCPIELEAVQFEMLTKDELNWLNTYHQTVFEKLSPSLQGDELNWLKQATHSL